MRRGRIQPSSSRARTAGADADDAKAAGSKSLLAPLLFLAIGVVFVVSTLYQPQHTHVMPVANTVELRSLIREQNATIRALARRVAHASEQRAEVDECPELARGGAAPELAPVREEHLRVARAESVVRASWECVSAA